MTDPRGHRLGTSSREAVQAVESALWRMMSFYDTPVAELDAAIALDPGWLLPPVMKAGFLLSLTEPALQAESAALLAAAAPLAAQAPEREQAHLEAVQALQEGRWAQACRIWDELLLSHPRDALALQWAHLWDFYRGDALNLRLRPARVLPDWDEADPLHPYVLGLYAFGLEENHLYAMAEDAGRRALAASPRVPWAVHAVAHVMEMQGRIEEGAGWLRQHQPVWAEGNGFSGHLWWHLALFRLEAMDDGGVLRVLDTHLTGDTLEITLQRVDAASLLWRLHLLGIDVAARCRALLDAWDAALDGFAGHYAFNDVHVLLTMLGAQEVTLAERWLARCAARAMAADGARRTNHAVAREVGLPLMRGLVAYARGEHAPASEMLYAARRGAQAFGGSHAQRDLIDQTVLAAASRGGRMAIGRALLNERVLAKPLTPLTRHWADRLGASLPERPPG